MKWKKTLLISLGILFLIVGGVVTYAKMTDQSFLDLLPFKLKGMILGVEEVSIGNRWIFDIQEDIKQEVDVDIIQINKTVLELTLFEHADSTTNNGYQWDMALCNQTGSGLQYMEEDAQGGFDNAIALDVNYGKLTDFGLNETWCGGATGYNLFSSGSKNQFPKKIRLLTNNISNFTLFAGTGSAIVNGILIVGAEHLDSNREFISDIYEEVRALDDIWSETIPDGDYVRVRFEIPLNSTRDITLFLRIVSGTPTIEVYEVNGTELIAEFTNLVSNEYNRVLMTNLTGSQDTFDLRVVGGSIEIDYIVDADITIDSDVDTVLNVVAQPRSLVWINSSTGYVFFSDSSQDLHYRKTTDSGASWGTEVTIRTGTMATFAIWYDKWTKDDTGDVIHIAFVDTAGDDITYNSFSTADDTLDGEVVVFDGTSASQASWATHGISLTKSRGGNIYSGGWINSAGGRGFFKATQSPATSFTSRADVTDGNEVDRIQFLAGNEADTNDIWSIYQDVSANEITLKVYDDSANSWSESSAIDTTTAEDISFFSFDSMDRHSDGHAILVLHNEHASSTQDLAVHDITNITTFSEKTNLVTDNSQFSVVGLLIDQNTDDLYVGYNNAGSTGQIVYKKSTDDAGTWGDETAMSVTGDDHQVVMGGSSVDNGDTGRWMPVWFNDDLNDLVTNSDNSIEITGAADTFPQWSDNSTNSTVAGAFILHSVNWTDDTALSGYIFSFCNGTYSGAGGNVVTFYNFSDSTNNKAFNGTGQNADRFGGTEATTEAYTNLESNNGVFANVSSGANQHEPFWRFNFTINETIGDINWINVSMDGFEDASPESATATIWNYTSSAWDVTVGTFPTSDSTISLNITSDFTDIINAGNSQLVVAVQGSNFDTGETIAVDFIEVEVDSSSGGGINSCLDTNPTFTNDTFVTMSGTQDWSNVSKVVNTTVGSTIKWIVYANDSTNQFNVTDTFAYNTTSAAVDCWTYHSGIKLLEIPVGCIFEQSTGEIREI